MPLNMSSKTHLNHCRSCTSHLTILKGLKGGVKHYIADVLIPEPAKLGVPRPNDTKPILPFLKPLVSSFALLVGLPIEPGRQVRQPQAVESLLQGPTVGIQTPCLVVLLQHKFYVGHGASCIAIAKRT
jgi:hypothetical protein